jgi:hypothetical protein
MTTTKIYTTILSLILLTVAACDKEDRCIRGEGDVKSKTVTLSEFRGVDLRLPGNVEIIKSNISKVEIQARENIIDLIRTDIVSGNLRLDMDNRCVKGKTDMSFKVYTPELGYLRVAGSGNINSPEEFPQRDWNLYIDGSGDINARINGLRTEATISGSGSMHINGNTNEFATRISGSGNIRAFDATTKMLTANISGSGNIEATVSETLSATISGSGNIRYKGQASVTNVNISGSGKLVKVN